MNQRPVLVLRPPPGNAVTAERLAAAGLSSLAVPLFAITAVAWDMPDPGGIDALLLTSANAVRHAGAQRLAALAQWPAWCVGDATAAAARDGGLTVARAGTGGIDSLLAEAPPTRLLWLSGEVVTPVHPPSAVQIERRIVYRALPLPVEPTALARDAIALVHSAAAGARLAALAPARAHIAIIAISAAAAAACGGGWHSLAWPSTPDDRAMVALAAQLCQKAS